MRIDAESNANATMLKTLTHYLRVNTVLEVQAGTSYPHIHMVFPYLKWLAPIVWMTEQWGQAENSVDYKVKDSLSPAS